MAAAKCTIVADSWMNNQKGQDPCTVAGDLRTPCGGPVFITPQLTNNSHYTPGDATHPADQCGCSWAFYNTIMACTFCQSVNGAVDVITWPEWMQGCSPALITNGSWFPPLYQIPTDTSVPHWAIQDPTSWTSERFDPTAAQAIANQNFPDLTNSSLAAPTPSPSPSSSKKSTPIGAIVGGVIGGLLVVVIIVFLLWYTRYKNRKLKNLRIPSIPLIQGSGHARNFSAETKPTPGAIVVGHDDVSPGTTWRSVTTTTPNGQSGHHHQNSNGSATDGGMGMGVMSSTPVGYGNGPPAHQRQISAESATDLSREAMITPWYPPEHGASPSGNGATPGPETPASRKAREAGRASPSQSSLTTSNTHGVSATTPGTGRRMNPPAYDESLIASPTNSRPPHNRTISNESNADVSSINTASGPYPTPTEFNGAAGSNSPLDSPAAASSGAYPPGLTGRGGALRSVTENREQPADYFGPSAWRRDTKERVD